MQRYSLLLPNLVERTLAYNVMHFWVNSYLEVSLGQPEVALLRYALRLPIYSVRTPVQSIIHNWDQRYGGVS